MLQARHFKWVPNALTLSRMVLAIALFMFAINKLWALAFWLFMSALLTDFLDGLAAKKFNAYSKYGMYLDSGPDSLLVIAGMTGLSAGGYVAWWFTVLVLTAGTIITGQRLLLRQTERSAIINKVISVSCLFIAWTGIAWFFVSLAYGWSWLYPPVTLLALAISASLKRHRLRTWLGLSSSPRH